MASLRIKPLALMLALATASVHAAPNAPAKAPATAPAATVDALASASAELQRMAQWVAASRDNAGMPYLLIDKVNARVYAFDGNGKLRSSAPALLGMARGDILRASNDTPVDDIAPEDRVTPAGRFVSRLAHDSHGKELLVIDYAASLSLHPIIKGTPEERRAERMRSATAQDNRISHGCINVPVDFYSNVVSPAFANTRGVVYILPETQAGSAMLGAPPLNLALGNQAHSAAGAP